MAEENIQHSTFNVQHRITERRHLTLHPLPGRGGEGKGNPTFNVQRSTSNGRSGDECGASGGEAGGKDGFHPVPDSVFILQAVAGNQMNGDDVEVVPTALWLKGGGRRRFLSPRRKHPLLKHPVRSS